MATNDRKTEWEIDDILAEAQQLKQQRLQQTRASDTFATPHTAAPKQAPNTVQNAFSVVSAMPSPQPLRPATPPVNTSSADSSAVPQLRPLDDRTRQFVPPAMAGTEADEEDVKVFQPRLVVSPVSNEKPKPMKTPVSAEAEEQLTLEGMGEATTPPPIVQADTPSAKIAQVKADTSVEASEEKIPELSLDAPEVDSQEQLEEQIRQARQERVSRFHFQLAGDEEEDNDPQEERESFEEEELEDYNSYEESEAVGSELTYRRRTGLVVTLLTALIELVLVCMMVLTFVMGAPPMDAYLYIGAQAFLLFVMQLLNHRLIGSGVQALLRFHATADTGASLASVFVLAHTLLQLLNAAGVASGTVELLPSVAGLGLLLGALGRQMRIVRIAENFRFVSYPDEKFAAQIIEDRAQAIEVGRSAVALGDPAVAYVRRTGFLTGFLEHSYADDVSDRVMRGYMPALLIAAALGAVSYALVSHDWWNALTLFTAAVCLGSPAAAVTNVNFPFMRAAKRSLRRGAMLVSWDTVRRFGRMHALAVDAEDLFPNESVLLHGIKTFSGARIDEAILDAAAVSIGSGGPLSNVFRRVIEDKIAILQSVDTLVYEQDMGLSGWVGGRRVLVGNRRLLENHGVDVPSLDYERRYMRDGRQLVYLSTAGELSAMFVVSYLADEGIQTALRNMTRAGLTLLVRTSDPNVTEELLCATFDLDEYYVEVLHASAGRTYERLAAQTTPQEAACLASNGRVEGLATALTGCRRLRRAGPATAALQIIGAVLGLAVSFFLMFSTAVPMPSLYATAYLLLWTFLSWLLPLFFHA